MDTVGIEIPNVRKRVDRRLAAAMVATGALVALGGGYAIGSASDAASPAPAMIVNGTPATWQDAVIEANAVKRHAAEQERATAPDIRMARVEE